MWQNAEHPAVKQITGAPLPLLNPRARSIDRRIAEWWFGFRRGGRGGLLAVKDRGEISGISRPGTTSPKKKAAFKQVTFKISNAKLYVSVGDEVMIDDLFTKPITAEESYWEFQTIKGQKCLMVIVAKREKWQTFEHLLVKEEHPADTEITHICFMDIDADGESLGRIIFGMYGNQVPKTVDNFRALCTGEKSTDEEKLGYEGSAFHRVIPAFMCQGGDYTKGDGTGGKSIYGDKFEDENFTMKHVKQGALSMANSGPNSNGSQFFITLTQTPHLDGSHVVFGEVTAGFFDVVKKMEELGSTQGTTSKKITIKACGELPLEDC
eukprot:GEMP01041431.1.p1 GENE.GEMP01041431.1~~GEMP01041431.1.p1  ORF type:complete len:323 (+),score=54.18 GEMP01041431.1:131-1099(+)